MADTPSGPVFRLIYRSHMRIPAERRKAALGTLFSTARSNNAHRGVTGALLVWEDYFVQALEGEEDVVRGLFDTIYRDTRHEKVTLVAEEPGCDRVFSRWSMARVSDDDQPDIPLLMNRDKGGISPAARRATTPDQDALLDRLREVARGTISA